MHSKILKLFLNSRHSSDDKQSLIKSSIDSIRQKVSSLDYYWVFGLDVPYTDNKSYKFTGYFIPLKLGNNIFHYKLVSLDSELEFRGFYKKVNNIHQVVVNKGVDVTLPLRLKGFTEKGKFSESEPWIDEWQLECNHFRYSDWLWICLCA